MTEVRWVNCRNCRISKRFPDPECAEHYAEYHRETFPDHNPTIRGEVDHDDQIRERRQRRRRQKEFWER